MLGSSERLQAEDSNELCPRCGVRGSHRYIRECIDAVHKDLADLERYCEKTKGTARPPKIAYKTGCISWLAD